MSREDTEDSGGSDDPLSEAVRTMWEVADPMPPGLVARVQLALDLEELETEVARLVELPELAAARSDEFARLVTFQSDSLTVMITFQRCVDGTTRIDGWLTPGACLHIELHCPAGPMSTESDDAGRFSLDAVPAGTVRLIVHDPGSSRRILTPTIEI